MKNLIIILSVLIAVLSLSCRTVHDASPADTNKNVFSAELIETENAMQIVVYDKTHKEQRLIWKTAKQPMVEGKSSKTNRLLPFFRWAPTGGLLLVATVKQRFENVYDPDGLIVYDSTTGSILWKKTLGRRWSYRSTKWAPDSKSIGVNWIPIGMPEANSQEPSVCILDAKSGKMIGIVKISDIQKKRNLELSTVDYISNFEFVTNSRVKIEISRTGKRVGNFMEDVNALD